MSMRLSALTKPSLRRGVLLALVVMARASGDEVDAGNSLDAVGIERGIARLTCVERESGRRFRGRAIVVDTDAASRSTDLLIAPAHVLPTEIDRIREDCTIVGNGGVNAPIATFLLPAGHHADLAADWVVLVTAAPLGGNVGRLRVGTLAPAELEHLLHDEAPLKLMLYSNSAEQNGCTFEMNHWTAQDVASGLFAHSCRTWDGVSGAPIAIEIDGAPVVVAMNIGRRLELSPRSSRRYVGIALAFNADLTAVIREAASRWNGGDAAPKPVDGPRRRRD